MPVHVKVGGVWKECDDVYIKVGGVWKTLDQAHVKVGGTWYESIITLLVIVAPNKSISNVRVLNNCTANVKVDNDGDMYASNNTGGYTSSYETWLDVGLNSQVWVQRVIISGTLTTDGGSGRLACTGDRIFGIQQTSVGIKTCTIDLNFYDAVSGGNLLDTQRVVLTAEYNDGT